jgi:hypothetical protein
MNVPAQNRPITAKDRDAIVTPVRDGLRELILGSPGLFNDRPGFVAAPPSGNPFTDLVRAVTQFNCRRWARSDKSRYSTRVNAGNADICGQYLDGLGENPEDGAIEEPFQGGQCVTHYLVVIEADAGPIPGTGIFANGWTTGPIVSWRTEDDGVRTRGFITSNSGFSSFARCSTPPVQGIQERLWFDTVSFERGPFRFSVLNSCVPDNCGNPPVGIRPPGRITGGTPPPPEITVEVPGFGPTTVTVNPGPDGGIEVCLPELQVCIVVGDDDDDGGGEPGEPEDPTPPNGPNENGPGDEDAVGDAGGENEDGDFGPPPEGRAWIGAFVQFTVPSKLGNIPSANPANPAYATVVGNVSLDHGGVFSDAKQARSRWVSCFRENPNLTVRGARVNTRPGVSFRVYPVSVEICPESLCPIGED